MGELPSLTIDEAAEASLVTAAAGDRFLGVGKGTVAKWAYRYGLTVHGTLHQRGKDLRLYALGDVVAIERDTRIATNGGKKRPIVVDVEPWD